MDEKESKRLQAEAIRLAEVLWAGRDDDTSRLLREGARAMRERDELLRCPFITHCQQPKSESANEERALADFTGALEEVRQKIAKAIGMPSGVPWETLIPGVELLASRCAELEAQTRNQATEVDVTVLQYEEVEQERDHWKKAHETAAEENEITARQLQEYASKVTALEEQLTTASGRVARSESERESILMALKTVRDIIVESDRLLIEALGVEPTKDAEYASDLLDNVRALIARLGDERETWETERGALKAEIARLNKDVAGYRQGDETLASSWKGHVWRLAAALGVPRPVMGRATDPSVDQIMQYINQNVLPMVEVSKRVDAIAQRLSPKITCKHCGAKYPVGVEFCPSCGKEES